MQLAGSETASQQIDRERLTEDVAERHREGIEPRRVGGKALRRLVPIALVLLGACGYPAIPPPPPNATPPAPAPDPTPEPTGSGGLLTSPVEQSKTLLGVAASTTDAHERCRLVREAASLDPSSIEARLTWAESRCAPAKDLLGDARASFEKQRDVRSALALLAVGTRAGASKDALDAAAYLSGEAPFDLTRVKLAIRTFVRFSDHARAIGALEKVIADRTSKGATIDAIDARLDLAIETVRNGASARAALLAILEQAGKLEGAYGTAWMAPKLVEAIAVLRSKDAEGASLVAAKAMGSPLFQTPDAKRALAIERAIAAARAGDVKALTVLSPNERKASRMSVSAARALLAVEAMLGGKCDVARAHVFAHASLTDGPLRLDDDVAFASGCGSPTRPPTLVPPRTPDDVEDALAIAPADPPRARALLETIAKARPNDASAQLAYISLIVAVDRPAALDAAIAREPKDPALHLARIAGTTGAARAAAARHFVNVVLPATIEVLDDKQAAATSIAAFLPAANEEPNDEMWADVAEQMLKSCTTSLPVQSAPACVPLRSTTARLRIKRPAVLATSGPLLADADLKDARVRLDVILALVAQNKTLLADVMTSPKRGAWSGAEASFARAATAAASKVCVIAKSSLASAGPTLASELPAETATIKARCP